MNQPDNPLPAMRNRCSLPSCACLGLIVLGLSLSGVLGGGNSRGCSNQPQQVVFTSGAAQVAGPELSFLKMLLPLTNMSAVSAGSLLDAGKASGLTSPEMRRIMQMHQSLFCT